MTETCKYETHYVFVEMIKLILYELYALSFPSLF